MEPGSRVKVIGRDLVGVLRFRGEVHFAKGEFAGIVLDEQKGKNNGTVQDQKYFECADGYGLMVPMDKIELATVEPTLNATSRTASEVSLASDRSVGEGRASTARKKSDGVSSSRPTTASSTSKKPAPARLQPPGSSVAGNTNMLPPSAMPLPRRSIAVPVVVPGAIFTEQQSIASHRLPTNAGRPSDGLITGYGTESSAILTPARAVNTDTKEYALRDQIAKLENEKSDLASKLDTLLLRRGEDKAKLREWEKLKLQYEHLEIHNKRITENNKELTEQLEDTKRLLAEQASELAEKSSLSSDDSTRAIIENLTLDKEIAQANAEMLADKNEQLSGRVKELEDLVGSSSGQPRTSLSTSPSSSGEKSDGSESTTTRLWQLDEENTKLRTACTLLHDALSDEKEEANAMRQELALVNPLYSQTNVELIQARQQLADMRDQLDSAASAQEMTEKLIETNLDLSEKVSDQNTKISQLISLRDANDELLEHFNGKEKDYLAALSERDAYISNLKRDIFSLQRERDNVAQQMERYGEEKRQVETANQTLRQQIDLVLHEQQSGMQQQTGRRDVRRATSEQLVVQRRMQSKIVAANVAAQRQRLDHLIATLKYDYALAFMPDSFSKARENLYIDAVCALIALLEKCTLLEQQVSKNFHLQQQQTAIAGDVDHHAVNNTETDIVLEQQQTLLDGGDLYHERDRSCFAAYLLFVCECVRYAASKISRRARAVADLTPLVGFVPKLNKAGDDVDYYVKLLQDNHLDENVAPDGLEQSFFTLLTEQRNINFGDGLISQHSANNTADGSNGVSDAEFLRSVLGLVDRAALSLNLCLTWLKQLHDDDHKPKNDKEGQFGDLLAQLGVLLADVMHNVSACRRLLDTEAAVYILKLPADFVKNLDTRPTILLNLVRLIYRWVRAASVASRSASNVAVTDTLSLLDADTLFGKLRDVNVALGAAAYVRAPQDEVCEVLSELATSLKLVSVNLENGQWFRGSFEAGGDDIVGSTTKLQHAPDKSPPFSPTKRQPQQHFAAGEQTRTSFYVILPGLARRAELFKKQLVDAEALRYDIENKKQEVADLQRHLRGRADEIDALQLRVSTFERKFESSSSSRESQLSVLKRENVELETKVKFCDAEVESQRIVFTQRIKELEREKQTLEQHLKQAGKRFLAGGSAPRSSGNVTDRSLADTSAAMQFGDDSAGGDSFNGTEYSGAGKAAAGGFADWTSYLSPVEELSVLRTIISTQSAELMMLRVKLADKLLAQLVPEAYLGLNRVNNNSVMPTANTDAAAIVPQRTRQNYYCQSAEKQWQEKAAYMQKQLSATRREYYELVHAIDFSASPQEMKRQLHERDQREALIMDKLQRLKQEMQLLEVGKKQISSGNFYVQ